MLTCLEGGRARVASARLTSIGGRLCAIILFAANSHARSIGSSHLKDEYRSSMYQEISSGAYLMTIFAVVDAEPFK